MSGAVDISELGVGYGGKEVLSVDSLQVQPGEFMSILGPSGCGKTTLLNTVSGFINPVRGHISIDGNDVTRIPTHKRNLGLVFQNYALFPHLTVKQNLEYGLKTRRLPRQERERRVVESLEIVGLRDFINRSPHQLSGGQQQRVALARALAIEPSVLLLDEPLSSLDAKLRRNMRRELRDIQKRVGTTMIFVTHDQDEALTMSDRVAVFAGGRLEQLGKPVDLYRNPATPFVADFLGAANILTGVAVTDERVRVGGVELFVPNQTTPGSGITFALRPEHIVLARESAATEGTCATVTYRAYGGEQWRLRVELEPGLELSVSIPDRPEAGSAPPDTGSTVVLTWHREVPTILQSGEQT
ncbi:Spermidine/putrescine import ATP-binding protein PotA [compost metagenome]